MFNVEALTGQPIGLSADEANCTNDHCAFIGHVLLTSGRTVLSADQLHFDVEEKDGKRRISHATATGDVLLIDGNAMTTCQRVDLNGDLVTGTLSLAEIRVKKPGSFDPKLAGFDAFGAGTDTVYVTGLITRTGQKSFVVKDAYFTPCDCGKDRRPIFSVKAQEARIELDSHAVFIKPVVQPGDLPFPFPFALPALYVPVSKRKTGILPPAFRVVGESPTPVHPYAMSAFYIEEALFVALGKSVDATATFGVNTLRGPRELLELRYAPDADVEGTLNLAHMWDSRFFAEERPTSELKENRVSAVFSHRSGTYGRLSARAFGQFFSDNALLGVQQYTVAAQATQYSASRVATDYRGDLWRVSLGAAVYQDFQAPTFFGVQQGRVVQRIPDIGAFLAPLPLPGGLRLSAEARFNAGFALRPSQTVSYEQEDPAYKGIRFTDPDPAAPAPVQQTITERFNTPTPYPDCATMPGRLLVDDNGSPLLRTDKTPAVDVYGRPIEVADRCARPLRFGRFDVMPVLSRPFQLGFLSVRPEVFGLFQLGADSLTNTLQPRGFAGMRVELSTLFGRVFEVSDDEAVRHRVRPILTYLLVPAVIGRMPQYIFDERDQFRATHQLTFGAETDLYRRTKGGGSASVLKLSVVQQVNLGFDGVRVRDLRTASTTDELRTFAAAPGFGSFSSRLDLNLLPVRAYLATTVDTQTKRLTELVSSLTILDGSGSSANVSYSRYEAGGYARMNTGLFELAPGGAVIPNLRSGAYHVASLSAVVQVLRGLFLSYSFSVGFGDGLSAPRLTVQGQTIKARLVGACECFGVDVSANFLPDFFTATPRPPTIDFSLTVGDYTFKPQ